MGWLVNGIPGLLTLGCVPVFLLLLSSFQYCLISKKIDTIAHFGWIKKALNHPVLQRELHWFWTNVYNFLNFLREISHIVAIYRTHPKQTTFTALVNILRLLFMESKLKTAFCFLLKYSVGSLSKLPLEDAGPCKHRAFFGTTVF